MAAEKIAKVGIKRDVTLMYFIRNGDVWAVPRKAPGEAKGRPKRVAVVGIDTDFSRYLYFVDNDGDVARLARQIGTSAPPRPAPPKKKKGSAMTKKATKTKVAKTLSGKDKDKTLAAKPARSRKK